MVWQRWWQGKREELFISLDTAWKCQCSLSALWPALAHLFGFHHPPGFGRARFNRSLALCFHNAMTACGAWYVGLHPSSGLAQTQRLGEHRGAHVILLCHKHSSAVSSVSFYSMAVRAYTSQHMAKFRNHHTNILMEVASFCWVVTQQQTSSLGSHLVTWHI